MQRIRQPRAPTVGEAIGSYLATPNTRRPVAPLVSAPPSAPAVLAAHLGTGRPVTASRNPRPPRASSHQAGITPLCPGLGDADRPGLTERCPGPADLQTLRPPLHYRRLPPSRPGRHPGPDYPWIRPGMTETDITHYAGPRLDPHWELSVSWQRRAMGMLCSECDVHP